VPVVSVPASAAKSSPTATDDVSKAATGRPSRIRTGAIKLGKHVDGQWAVTSVDAEGRESVCSNTAYVPQITLAHGLALAPDGAVLISDGHPHGGLIVSLPGGMAGPDWMFMPGAGGDGRMLGLAIHEKPGGDLPYRIVAVNNYAHRLHFFDPQGRYLSHIGDRAGNAHGQFSAPSGVAVGHDGRCYVTDTGNRRVQVFNPDGKFLTQFGDTAGPGKTGPLEEPVGIALDSRGRAYVVDRKAGRVVVYQEGKPLRTFGTGELQSPRWIALRNDGVICVSQPGKQEIVAFSASGKKVVASQGQDPEHTFGRVQGIAFDRRGTLWIASEQFGGHLHRYEIARQPRK
jgi:hypothetical protein